LRLESRKDTVVVMVTYLYNHATIGDGFEALKSIRDPDVNLSIARNVVSPETSEYLRTLDWHGHFKSEWDSSPVPPGREGICNRNCFACPLEPFHGDRLAIRPADFGVFDPDDAADVIKAGLDKFPQSLGLNALEHTIVSAVQGFGLVTDAENVRADVIAKYPVGSSAWHQDGNLHTRGLITFMGPGTFWRPNDTVAEEDWARNVRFDGVGRRMNGYGLFGMFMEHAEQIETAHMAVFKGGLGSERPLIHAEPTHSVTNAPREMRLILTIDKV
jgi:hypothetical protein